MIVLFLTWGVIAAHSVAHAQVGRTPLYTVLQAGGMLGISHSVEQAAPMNGYQFQFIIGKSFGIERNTQLGLGLGNDVFRGSVSLDNGNTLERRVNTLPLFLDFRQQIGEVFRLGAVGFVADWGYALPMGGEFHHGWVGKLGLSYAHLLADRSALQFTFGWGMQQFRSHYLGSGGFHQQQLFLTIGLFSR